MVLVFGFIGCGGTTTTTTTTAATTTTTTVNTENNGTTTTGTGTTTTGTGTTTTAAVTTTTTTAAGTTTTGGANSPIVIWVGSESQAFYQQKMDDYVTNYPTTHSGADFPYTVSVVAADTASAAAIFLDDTVAGPDILTVAHDNLGKLIAGTSAIAPVTSTALLTQINNDNPQIFLNVIKGDVGGNEYTFGVPYIAQSLVLYYNTQYITPTQAQTWEGIWQAAKDAGKQALTFLGTDGFNQSFLLLATRQSDHYTSLELYKDGVQTNCFATGDDTIAKMKWGQRFFGDPNGAHRPSDSGWAVELQNEVTLSVIGGAWNFNAAQAALGSNLGIAILPTFTLTAADAYGTATAGTVYRSGTFADTKMFVMKLETDQARYNALQDILLYLSSKDMQEQSFAQCNNLPAYKNAQAEFPEFQADTLQATLANAETDMFQWGIPQPFGVSAKYNVYYYSKGAPDLFMAILENTGGLYSTDQQIYDELANIQNIWETGQQLTTS